MANNLAKEKAFKVLIQNKLYSLTNYNDLQRIIESNQFTIIEYKKHNNSDSVSELISKLKIENSIEQNDSFLYINNNLKFLFINSDIPNDDKCSLLRHELGHIYDPDLKNSDLQNSRIKREEFANEFSCYAKNPGIGFMIRAFLIKNRILLVTAITLVTCIFGSLFFINPQPVPVANDTSSPIHSASTYYVTSAGSKYHRKHCIIIKYKNNVKEITLNEAIDNGYKPCMICIAQE